MSSAVNDNMEMLRNKIKNFHNKNKEIKGEEVAKLQHHNNNGDNN